MADQQGRVYVTFTAEIIPQTVEPLIQTFSNLIQQQVQEVYLAFSTPGGSVMDGITLYNFLRGLPLRLITHNIGNVDSIGNVVFLAGEERLACKTATFMFHGVGQDRPAGRYEEKLLQEMLSSIQADQTRISRIIAAHTTISQDETETFFREAQTLVAEEARDRGIVHNIAEFHLPPNVPVISLVFPR